MTERGGSSCQQETSLGVERMLVGERSKVEDEGVVVLSSEVG
jgi:hypothetical protein